MEKLQPNWKYAGRKNEQTSTIIHRNIPSTCYKIRPACLLERVHNQFYTYWGIPGWIQTRSLTSRTQDWGIPGWIQTRKRKKKKNGPYMFRETAEIGNDARDQSEDDKTEMDGEKKNNMSETL